jgi:hypothetical protein
MPLRVAVSAAMLSAVLATTACTGNGHAGTPRIARAERSRLQAANALRCPLDPARRYLVRRRPPTRSWKPAVWMGRPVPRGLDHDPDVGRCGVLGCSGTCRAFRIASRCPQVSVRIARMPCCTCRRRGRAFDHGRQSRWACGSESVLRIRSTERREHYIGGVIGRPRLRWPMLATVRQIDGSSPPSRRSAALRRGHGGTGGRRACAGAGSSFRGSRS